MCRRQRLRFRVLVDRSLELTPRLTWSAVTSGAALLRRPGREVPLSKLASLVLDAAGYENRRYAMYLHRRVAAPVCFTVAAPVSNAMWPGAPFDDATPNRHIIHEEAAARVVEHPAHRVPRVPRGGRADRRGGRPAAFAAAQPPRSATAGGARRLPSRAVGGARSGAPTPAICRSAM
ncbi:hypothetical protein GCM10023082_09370 [Streptomyces tremellae]|uniref:Uncharacterized protein n=1 Tax=Streptomyces tremellae TaxID=1124239 RepID=A0ABP7E5P3_9ACTN